MALEIRIDRETCMGSVNCSFWAPHTFDLDADGKATVVDAAGDPDEKILGAADGCPTAAIRVARDGQPVRLG